MQTSGFAASSETGKLQILAATGDFGSFVDQPMDQVVSPEMKERIQEALERQESLFTEDAFIGYFRTDNNTINLLYLHGCKNLDFLEKDLLRTFSSNIAIAFDKIFLTQEIHDTQREVIETLGSVVESRSNETANHVRRVAEFTHFLALKTGMDDREATLLKQASFMHDVGKIGIPDALLNKPGALTKEEFDQVKSHTTIGHTLLKNSQREILQKAAIVALQHHERWDGQGYPQGLSGGDIHIFGRITALADVFDALFNKRVYRDALPLAQVVEILKEEKGRQFDPELTDLFLENIDDFVRLNQLWPD